MTDTFIADALPVSISGPVKIGKVSLLDLLQEAYGDQAGSIQSVRIGYWDKDYLAGIKDGDGNLNPFRYWDADPKNQLVSTVLNNGKDIGGSHFDSMGNAQFKPITVDAAHFKDIQIQIGNNIMPNIGLQIPERVAADGSTVWHDLAVTTVPHQLTTHGPSSHAPTAADIVSTAKFFASVEHGVANTNDCHWIATVIGASAGATLDPNTQSIDPTMNEEGGFWRIAYRGTDDNAVINWQEKVHAGDIVRLGWATGGFHTVTVTAGLNADGKHPGQIQVVDNTGDPAVKGGLSTIQEHWVDFDGRSTTDKESVTIYRLTTDDKFLIDQSKDGHGNTILGTGFNDLIKGGAGADTLRGGEGNDDLRGGSGNDTLVGGSGDDTLDGGIGRDTMRGGSGNDTYVVNSSLDVVDDTFNIHGRHIDAGGIDTVRVSLSSYSLENHKEIENLTFIGSGDFTGTGNDKANVILGGFGKDTLSGGAGNDTLQAYNGDDRLDGGTGADTMMGGRGNDTYVVDNVKDVVSELGPDATVIPMPFGMDIKIPGDMGGIDTIETTLSSFALNAASSSTLAWIENLTFTGTGNFVGTGNFLANTIIGGAGDDQLFGMEGADSLYGGSGDDVLNGGTGDDRMVGGAGNDVYLVDSVNDKVVEQTARRFPTDSGGSDEIRTTLATYSLQNNASISGKVENLSFIGSGNFVGTGNELDNILSGNNGADTLRGGEGNDTLRGGAGADKLFGEAGNDSLVGGTGADTMSGGKGNDTYYVDNAGDVVQEGSVIGTSNGSGHWGDSGGIDEVRTTLSSYTMSSSNAATADFRGVIENLTFNGTGNFEGHGNGVDNVITGGAGNDRLFGNAGADTLFGGAGNDSLFGGTGKDVLTGGAGADHLTGGTGADRFVLALGDNGVTAKTADHIQDFEKGDTLDVSDFVASHSSIEASRNFGGDIGKALDFANAQLAAGHNVAGSAVLTDTASHNVYVFMDQDGDHKFESAVILDHADTHKSEIHTEILQHQLFI